MVSLLSLPMPPPLPFQPLLFSLSQVSLLPSFLPSLLLHNFTSFSSSFFFSILTRMSRERVWARQWIEYALLSFLPFLLPFLCFSSPLESSFFFFFFSAGFLFFSAFLLLFFSFSFFLFYYILYRHTEFSSSFLLLLFFNERECLTVKFCVCVCSACVCVQASSSLHPSIILPPHCLPTDEVCV